MQNGGRFTWIAKEMGNKFPYICASQCKLGYVWRQEARKCVKVIKEAAKFTEAELQCSIENGRLASVFTCNQFVGLALSLWNKYSDLTNTYWFGIYFDGLDSYTMRKSGQIIGSSGFSTVNANSLTDCTANNVEMTADGTVGLTSITPRPLGYHGEMIYKTDKSAKVKVYEFGLTDATVPGKYLCEKETDYICPQGFLLFQQLCYKLHQEEVEQAEAERVCVSYGGNLLKVQTGMQHTFIVAALNTNSNFTKVWLTYQKQTQDPTENTYYPTSVNDGPFMFDSIFSSSTETNSDEINCVLMDSNDAEKYSWKKVSCHSKASFICENPLILNPELVRSIPKIQALLPLDELSGFTDLATATRINNVSLVSITSESVFKSGLTGAAYFMGYTESYIDVETKDNILLTDFGISISMWVNIEKIFDNEVHPLIDGSEDCIDGTEKPGFTMMLTRAGSGLNIVAGAPSGCFDVFNNSKSDSISGTETDDIFVTVLARLCTIKDDGSLSCSTFSSSFNNPLSPETWHHIGFTFDDVENRGTFFVDETFGYTDITVSPATVHDNEYFTFDSKGWMSTAMNSFVRIGSLKNQAPEDKSSGSSGGSSGNGSGNNVNGGAPTAAPTTVASSNVPSGSSGGSSGNSGYGKKHFNGLMSCLQIYEGPLNSVQFHHLASCPVPLNYQNKATLCPTGYDYYKQKCYKLSLSPQDFATAEAFCTSSPG